MATDAGNHSSFAMRLGQSLGRGVNRILRAERFVWAALGRGGVPGIVLSPLKWIVRAVVLGAGAFFAAWGLLYMLAVLAFVAIAIGLITDSNVESALIGSQRIELDEHEEVYGAVQRHGPQGYGWYVGGARVE